MERWTEAGFDPDRFWKQTPKLIRAALDGYTERCLWESKLAHSGAWWAAMLGRMKDPPSLGDLLGEKPKEQTGDDIAAAIGAWERATSVADNAA